jgi:hypothetical protein
VPSEFVAIEGEADATSLEQEVYEAIEAAFGDWTPAEGNLEVWLTKAFSRIGATIFDQASILSAAAFKRFGEAIAGVPPIQAAPATALTQWTMVDTAGYTIPAGTQVAIAATGDQSVGFKTAEDATIAPGGETTTIFIEAVEPGEEGNGLEGTPSLIDALAFVKSITVLAPTSGGVDEEDEDAYLNRLVETLQLLSLSLIIARDFEIDARAVAGIDRAKAIEAYNAAESKEEALAVSVFPVDADGAKLSAGVKEILQERQQAKVPSGVDVHVADPSYTPIIVVAKVSVDTGFDPATVTAAGESVLSAYLSPAEWGKPQSGDLSGSGWTNQTTLYYNELISELDRAAGVGRVITLLVGGGTGKAFTVAAATDVFSSTAHGFSNGDAVVLRSGLVPGAPLATGTVYYVRDAEANAFKLTATVGGAAINITSDGSGSAVKVGIADVSLAGTVALPEPAQIVVTS